VANLFMWIGLSPLLAGRRPLSGRPQEARCPWRAGVARCAARWHSDRRPWM